MRDTAPKKNKHLATTRELPKSVMISTTMPTIAPPPGVKRGMLGTIGAGYSWFMTGALKRPFSNGYKPAVGYVGSVAVMF